MDSPLASFDFSVLDDPHFKEDAVREEIVAPLLWSLGYAASGPATIRRTKPLEHPYVSIGSVRRKISLYPDYLLEFGGAVVCVVDAKRPDEDVMDKDHLSQAYTYAVHRDVKAGYYALCNGRRFVLFKVDEMTNVPALDFELTELASRWPEVQARLEPHRLAKRSGSYSKDFGLHLERIGILSSTDLIFPQVPIFQVARADSDVFCLMANTVMEESQYAACFDFDATLLTELMAVIPSSLAKQLQQPLSKWPTLINVGSNGAPVAVSISARISERLVETEKEIFRPLQITRFIA